MKLVVFGLSISSAWGNGHATLLRGLFRALHSQGHDIEFFEHDAPYYAEHRDVSSLPYADLRLYADWTENLPAAKRALEDADVAVVTSYCPHGPEASELILQSKSNLRSVFYDMDTPVTLNRLDRGEPVPYLPVRGLDAFDLVLSYTGGEALRQMRERLGARRAESLYGWVDPEIHSRAPVCAEFAADLSYLGTYASDRQASLEQFLISPAVCLTDRRFVIAGAMYPNPDGWPANVRYFSHIAPPQHSAFYSSSPLTLSVTRGSMASMGYCPSGRLFEAAACGTAVLSDWWKGLDEFFEPNEEILIATSSLEAITAITKDRGVLEHIGRRARERTMDSHTATIRARRLIDLIESSSDQHDTEPSTLSGRL